jgi:hypothetical protein
MQFCTISDDYFHQGIKMVRFLAAVSARMLMVAPFVER